MPARAFVIRFPNGDFEYDFTRRTLPSIGDTMRRNGLLWLVTRITQGRVVTVHVEHVDTPVVGPPQVRSLNPDDAGHDPSVPRR